MKSPRNRRRPQPRTPRRALRAGDPVEAPKEEPKKKAAKKSAKKPSPPKEKPTDE